MGWPVDAWPSLWKGWWQYHGRRQGLWWVGRPYVRRVVACWGLGWLRRALWDTHAHRRTAAVSLCGEMIGRGGNSNIFSGLSKLVTGECIGPLGFGCPRPLRPDLRSKTSTSRFCIANPGFAASLGTVHSRRRCYPAPYALRGAAPVWPFVLPPSGGCPWHLLPDVRDLLIPHHSSSQARGREERRSLTPSPYGGPQLTFNP